MPTYPLSQAKGSAGTSTRTTVADSPTPAPVPPPPPGPGVQPPFPAAPVEGRSARLWLGLGLAGAVFAVCCGLGTVAVGGFFVIGAQALNEQAHRAVGDYLDAIRAGAWPEAYQLRCAQDQEAETLTEFTQRVVGQPRIIEYELGELRLSDLELPVNATYQDRTEEELLVPLEQDTDTGQLEVCGFER